MWVNLIVPSSNQDKCNEYRLWKGLLANQYFFFFVYKSKFRATMNLFIDTL